MDWVLDFKQKTSKKKPTNNSYHLLSVALCEIEGSVYLHLPVEETLRFWWQVRYGLKPTTVCGNVVSDFHGLWRFFFFKSS